MYETNKNDSQNGLYNHMGIYTNEICVFKINRDDAYFIEPFYPYVISCPAVNKEHALKNDIKEDIIYDTMIERIRLVLEMAKTHIVDILILGAYGCGVFGNNPKDVKEIFMGLLEKDFEKVVFAIPNEERYELFKEQS